MAVNIRNGNMDDLDQLIDLYNHYINNTATTFDIEPFTRETRAPWLAKFSDTGRYRIFVAEEDGVILGYASSGEFRQKRAYETSIETSIYLKADANIQGKGLGSLLYSTLFEALAQEDVHRAYAGVTVPNEASVKIHQKFGFKSTGVFREVGRKMGKYWDVEWFEKSFE